MYIGACRVCIGFRASGWRFIGFGNYLLLGPFKGLMGDLGIMALKPYYLGPFCLNPINPIPYKQIDSRFSLD